MKKRRLCDQIHSRKSNRLIRLLRLRIYRLKAKRHSNRSKKSFYKTRYWELFNQTTAGSYADIRNNMKRSIARAYRRSDNVCVVHCSMGSFHNSANNFYTFTATDAKTGRHILTVDTIPEEELTLRLAAAGYDQIIWSHVMPIIIE